MSSNAAEPSKPSTTPAAGASLDGTSTCAPVCASQKADSAKFARQPTPEERKAIEDLIAAKKYQDAINKTLEAYGIDLSQYKGLVGGQINYVDQLESDDDGAEANYAFPAGTTVNIGPDVFGKIGGDPFGPRHSAGYLATTILHELTHVNQNTNHPPTRFTGDQYVNSRETMAYGAAHANADAAHLTDDEKKFLQKQQDEFFNKLTDDNKKLYNSCQYWGMDERRHSSSSSDGAGGGEKAA
jgi:hypothetical protein